MIAHFIVLAVHAHAAWPAAPLERVAVASAAAVFAETDQVPAELLVAIAQHESDLEPRAVSWRRRGETRVDILWVDGGRQPPATGPLACGLVSAIAPDRASCAKLLDPTAAMAAAVAELAEEIQRCRGSMRCALSCYAGGNAGIAAWRARRRTTATGFADLFFRRAEQLGARFGGASS